MKKYLIVFMVLFLTSCNIAQFAQTIMLKDSKGNKYALTMKYDDTVHMVGMSISYDGKKYTCEVAYDKEFNPEAMIYEVDLDVLANTGMGLFIYKGQKYSCKIDAV